MDGLRLKQQFGALIYDMPRYLWHFAKSALLGDDSWLKVRNRDETLIPHNSHPGLRCDWQWTTDLHLPRLYSSFGNNLFSRALGRYPIDIDAANHQKHNAGVQIPEVSFIIGHRGLARLPLLLKTIDSILNQTGCVIECIVVEQDDSAKIAELLPAQVRYHFTPTTQEDMPYSRAWAFNEGARLAQSECLIFHDNDLLVPRCYAKETLALQQQGYEFINLKRFIFYLSQASTQAVLNSNIIEQPKIESIMQNAEGGGSLGADKAAFARIGRFDQRFVGWGGEDSEFWERAQTAKSWSYAHLPLIHLWHGAQAQKYDEENATFQLYKELSLLSPEQRISDLLNKALRDDAQSRH